MTCGYSHVHGISRAITQFILVILLTLFCILSTAIGNLRLCYPRFWISGIFDCGNVDHADLL